MRAGNGKRKRCNISRPPGITYYHEVMMRPEHVGRTVWRPTRRPLARGDNYLEDEEIIQLLRELKYHVLKRGLSVAWAQLEPRHPSGISIRESEEVEKKAPEPEVQPDLFETSVQALTHATMEQFFGVISGAA
jgi:hypothetical protein